MKLALALALAYHGKKNATLKGFHFRACQELCKNVVESDGSLTI